LGSTSSIATAVNSESVRSIPVLVPSSKILALFLNSVRPMFDKIKMNQRESSILAALRDALLPKLISGELRVTNMNSMELTAA
jgi:type I restriction enzyme S subunit